ncbi:MAG: hypothetical protein NW201_00185 [Gemmatimonadales bacterium]|nr:hypothetical protein [Gemmatimonadales bacterium]
MRGIGVVVALLLAPVAAMAQQVSVAQLAAEAKGPVDSSTFVVSRGGKVVATERVRRVGPTVTGDFLPNAADPVRTRWEAVVTPEGAVGLLEVTEKQGLDTGKVRARVIQRGRAIWKGDSVAMEAMTSGGLHMRFYKTTPNSAPYLNLSFGLLDVALQRVLPKVGESAPLPLFNLTGGVTATATVTRPSPDSARVRLGTVEFALALDARGRVRGGGIPAQGVEVRRE